MATVVKIAHCWELLHCKCHVFHREIPLFTKEQERRCQNARSKDEVRGILQSCAAPIKELVTKNGRKILKQKILVDKEGNTGHRVKFCISVTASPGRTKGGSLLNVVH